MNVQQGSGQENDLYTLCIPAHFSHCFYTLLILSDPHKNAESSLIIKTHKRTLHFFPSKVI